MERKTEAGKMQPQDKKTLVLKMRRFKTRDGGEGYALRGSLDIGNNKSISVDVRCTKDGMLKVETDKRSGKPIVFANAAMWKNEARANGEGFGRGRGNGGGSSPW